MVLWTMAAKRSADDDPLVLPAKKQGLKLSLNKPSP